MRFFVDDIHKFCYIVAPKCGNSSIAKNLGVPVLINYSEDKKREILFDSTYTKVIIVRQNLVDRFLSGLYEEMFPKSGINGEIYANINLTFGEFLESLFAIIKSRAPNVQTISHPSSTFASEAAAQWRIESFGGPITDEFGTLVTHMGSQFWWISDIVRVMLTAPTPQPWTVIDTANICQALDMPIVKNVKKKISYSPKFYQRLYISEIIQKKRIATRDCLTAAQLQEILALFAHDQQFIDLLYEHSGEMFPEELLHAVCSSPPMPYFLHIVKKG